MYSINFLDISDKLLHFQKLKNDKKSNYMPFVKYGVKYIRYFHEKKVKAFMHIFFLLKSTRGQFYPAKIVVPLFFKKNFFNFLNIS